MKLGFAIAGIVALVIGGLALIPATSPAAGKAPDTATYKVHHTDEEWRKLLSPAAYNVLREEGTEAPFTSPLLDEHRKGVFVCAACGQEEFESSTKFDSGTGWPSFWKPIKGAVLEKGDKSLGMDRTEIKCSRCGSHLGHVFDDGPKPTGLRYCMNGVALKFKPATK